MRIQDENKNYLRGIMQDISIDWNWDESGPDGVSA